MRVLPLSGRLGAGRFTLIDDDDFEWLSAFRWTYERQTPPANRHGSPPRPKQGFAASNTGQPAMHRAILQHRGQTLTDLIVRHRNGWMLDNRKENLKLGTRNDNRRTSRRQNIHSNGTEWRVVLGSTDYGLFPSKEAAQAARDEIAQSLGYSTITEQQHLLAALTEALDGMVQNGLLTFNAEATLLEDRYQVRA